MKTANISITDRIRLAALRGLVKLIARAIAPALRTAAPARAHQAQTGHETHSAHDAHEGRVIDGEYRRVDARHNDRW